LPDCRGFLQCRDQFFGVPIDLDLELLGIQFIGCCDHIERGLSDVAAIQDHVLDPPFGSIRFDVLEDSFQHLLAVEHRVACFVQFFDSILARKSIDTIVRMLIAAVGRFEQSGDHKRMNRRFAILDLSALLVRFLFGTCKRVPYEESCNRCFRRIITAQNPNDLAMKILDHVSRLHCFRKWPTSKDLCGHLLKIALRRFDKRRICAIKPSEPFARNRIAQECVVKSIGCLADRS
jgi:hypothetical protein